jgi:hypothetical protein
VVSVLSEVSWGVGLTDPIYFSGQISTANRQEVQLIAYLDLSNVEVLFKFRIYNYDPDAKKYFQSFHAKDAEMKGILEKNGADLTLSCTDDPSDEVKSPLNFSFHIGILPQPSVHSITIATADQKNVVKGWGLKG